MLTWRIVLVAVVFLAIGLVVGFQFGAEVVQPSGPARDRTVELWIEGNQIRDHHPIYVWVARGDPIVWKGIRGLSDFEVSIRPCEGQTGAPPSPFKSGETHWRAVNGRVEAGAAANGAIGRCYKSTIKAQGLTPLDPHIYFHDGTG